MPERPTTGGFIPAQPRAGVLVLNGLPVSAGFAAAPVHRVARPPQLPERGTPGPSDGDRAVRALTDVAAQLRARAAAATEPAVAEILTAQAMMAEDPVLHDAVAGHVEGGLPAEHAIDAALSEHRAAFLAAGGYLAERVADLDDLRDRAVAACLGLPMPGIPSPGHPYVLAARDLAPADTAGLDPETVLALVTEEGGPTSHTAIVARALGIAAVVRCPGILEVPDGTPVAVDGTTGEVRVRPEPAWVEQQRQRDATRRARLARSTGPGRTADGHAVALLANIGSAADLPATSSGTTAGEAGPGEVEGVGLFRTELLYLDRVSPPSHDEQVAAYAAVFERAAGRRVIIRTLDAGADKPIPFLHQPDEPNPALGMRGLRLSRRHPDMLLAQLSAIAAAARATRAHPWVMAPMVATAVEARQFAAWCHEAGLFTVGIMIEIPAAALRAAELLSEVDFLSIGTNDLSQYTFAADRMSGELADLLDPWQPALLSLVAACGEAGRAAGKPVGVCGEAAADPALAPVLVGLGVSSLSMAPRAVAAVRESLAVLTLPECRQRAAAALAGRRGAAPVGQSRQP